jgi:hypothetical protein
MAIITKQSLDTLRGFYNAGVLTNQQETQLQAAFTPLLTSRPSLFNPDQTRNDYIREIDTIMRSILGTDPPQVPVYIFDWNVGVNDPIRMFLIGYAPKAQIYG